MSKLAIVGASGHGRVVGDAALESGLWSDIVFFDDQYPKTIRNGHWDVIGTTEDLIERKEEFSGVIVAIGDNVIRLQKQQFLEQSGCVIATIIHPSATISRFASIQKGSVVFAGAIINPFVQIGQSVIVNTAATIDHDCFIGDGAHVAPGAHIAGGVKVGTLSWIGIGATIKQYLEIGNHIIIGAGAAVVSHLHTPGTYTGIPATLLERKSSC